MQDLDFAAVRRVEELLASAPLDDLVAVFSQASGEQRLVYNAAARPAATDDHATILLDDLREVDFETYDGLFVAFSALDVIHEDALTKGAGFYPLEAIFLKRGARPALHRTLRNLARSLVSFMNSLSDADTMRRRRVTIKIVQLALPALLDERGAEGLVAVLPGDDLARFVERGEGKWLTVADDLTLPAPGDERWIVAMEELRRFNPALDPDDERFIELRGVLRQAGYVEALQHTCRALARRCVEQDADQPAPGQDAWALMAEAWLAREDVEDLVAFFPCGDFERFARTGEGLRVYRTLDPQAAAALGPRWPLADLERRGIPPEFAARGLALISLEVLVGEGAQGVAQANLGWLLWKAGHETTLARMFALLARDALAGGTTGTSWSPAILSDLARRAMLLISMGNPWTVRQGRYAQLMSSAYETLLRTLQHQAQTARGERQNYFQALVKWYACYSQRGAEIESHLHEMMYNVRTFLRASRDETDEYPAYYRQTAQQLMDVGEAALYPSVTMKLEARAERRPDHRYQWRKALVRFQEPNEETPYLSSVFERAIGRLMELREERQQALMYEHNMDVLQRKLMKVLNGVRRQRRLIVAPQHEMAVLAFICDREIAVVEERLGELGTTRIAITPVNSRIEHLREVTLTFEVRNIGRVETQNVELVLEPNSTFERKDRSSIHEFPRLAPGETQRFSYRVRAAYQSEARFDFTCNYSGLKEAQKVAIHLPVRGMDEAPFEMKSDKYNFGRFIQNPDDFYGREEEIKGLLASLQGGGHTNFLLRGPRRMGKTSMLYMLKHTLEEPDLRRRFGIPERWDAVLNRYHPVMLDLQGFRFQDDDVHVRRFFRQLLDAVCAAVVPDRRDELLASFDTRCLRIEARRAVLEQLERIFRDQPQARVLILLDEYDELYRPQGHDLDTALRFVVQHEQHLTWIIASTLFIFKESKSFGSPWFNILNTIELGCLTHEAARRLAEEPSREEGIEWQSDATVALLDETGRHPAFLQLFCSRIIGHLNRQRQSYVRPETFSMLAEQLIEERETIHSHFEFYWADTSGVGQLILLAADASERPPARNALWHWVEAQFQSRFGAQPETWVRDATGKRVSWLEHEFEDGMAWTSQVVNAISFDRASRTYAFTVPLFRRWLQRKHRSENLLEAALSTIATELERDGVA